ncbi:hypothetical protein JJB11_24395 [Ramlibacter ginsenosidimutans]|uniref:Transferrin-binding protein-like solute binding protein n=1 Tax=Ramlibacter ginsenosidimutans TaxID=502333 RepID=A0A934TXU6_9BURK|nr:hypothetical protein [Ramlibacter ginsenosidimutans]MBK6009251.1 hypothetical protein [Ramlibacter ginsenosidimutans]
MQKTNNRVARWSGVLALSAAVAACGGGGGSSTPAPAPPPDARNGTYTMVAADAQEYQLALDFDAKTYHVTGNSVDQSGNISEQSGTFFFSPGNATGATGASTTRFQVATDTIVGEYPLPSGALPFVAPRKFATTLADAVGVYNFLGRVVDTSGAAPNTTIQQAQITADAHFNECEDNVIYDMPNCPATSVTTGTITVSGNLFTAQTANGKIPFHVALVGNDKVFLRASGSIGTQRRYIVGLPAAASFTGGGFAGATTEPAWGTVTLAATSFSSTGTSPAGTTTTRSGTGSAIGNVPGILGISTASSGSFFAVNGSELGVVVAARGNAVVPGFMAIGRKQ